MLNVTPCYSSSFIFLKAYQIFVIYLVMVSLQFQSFCWYQSQSMILVQRVFACSIQSKGVWREFCYFYPDESFVINIADTLCLIYANWLLMSLTMRSLTSSTHPTSSTNLSLFITSTVFPFYPNSLHLLSTISPYAPTDSFSINLFPRYCCSNNAHSSQMYLASPTTRIECSFLCFSHLDDCYLNCDIFSAYYFFYSLYFYLFSFLYLL